jgi:DNA primase
VQSDAARAYLQQRGIGEEEARTWTIGYGGSSAELRSFLGAKRVPESLAVHAGFLTERGASLFAGRLTFSIREHDRTLGFGGRRIGEGAAPKYVNSAEGPLFQKAQILYGWSYAVDALRRHQRAVVVEGFLDVLACHRAGVSEAVAPLGTALTAQHAGRLKGLAKKATLLFDQDSAGQRAARRATMMLSAAGIECNVAQLDAGDDPDSLVRERGALALAAQVAAARPAIEFFIEREVDPSASIAERARAAQALGPLIHACASKLERELLTAKLAERVGMDAQDLAAHLRAPAPPQEAPPAAPASADLRLLSELLLFPRLRARWGELCQFVDAPTADLLRALASGGDLADTMRSLIPAEAARMLRVKPRTDVPEDEAEHSFADVLKRARVRHINMAINAVLSDLREAERNKHDPEPFIRRLQELNRHKREFNRAVP